MVKILSGWSRPGGSTTAFINLTNFFNANEIECIYYGPHSYHLDKCRGAELKKFFLEADDRVICHFLDIFDSRPHVARFLLSLHEKELFPLRNYDYTIYDAIHYVSESQKEWHGCFHPYFICPNMVNELRRNEQPPAVVTAGVIGSVDANKNVHVSIRRALAAGMERVLVFGRITDREYYDTRVAPLVDGSRVVYCGHQEDRQAMYDQLTDVFQDSLSESWGYIQRECELAGVRYHGSGVSERNHKIRLTNEQIFAIWAKQLGL